VSFKYDPFGRRIYKLSSAGTSIYAYDGDNVVEEVNSSGAVVARYTQTADRLDEPVAMLRSSATSYYQADALGTITSLSNAAGSLAQTYTFDSFGKQTASSGSLTNPFQYTAREFDPETNLYFYRARYYDQSSGRFLSEDPLKGVLRHNRYRYVSNSPTVLKDAYGLQEQCTFNGTQQITPWMFSIKRSPVSGWQFLASYAEDPDEGALIPAALVTCLFERTITKETWKSALFLLSWNCEEGGPCGATHRGNRGQTGRFRPRQLEPRSKPQPNLSATLQTPPRNQPGSFTNCSGHKERHETRDQKKEGRFCLFPVQSDVKNLKRGKEQTT
jgi:RHS repeat-associated protein